MRIDTLIEKLERLQDQGMGSREVYITDFCGDHCAVKNAYEVEVFGEPAILLSNKGISECPTSLWSSEGCSCSAGATARLSE